MTYDRKRKIRIIKGLRKIFKINKYNSEEISRYGSYALLASYWPKPWKFTLTSILCKYKKALKITVILFKAITTSSFIVLIS